MTDDGKATEQWVRTLIANTRDKILARIDPAAQFFLLLTVRPQFRGGEAVVDLQLSTSVEPTDATDDPALQPWEVPYSAFGVDAPIDVEGIGERLPELKPPEVLLAGLRYRLALKQAPEGKPLWLKLARPYGILAAAAWESELATALKRPVLRLPDYPDRPVERPDTLECAVIVDADPDTDATDLARRVRALVDVTLAKSSRTMTRVHVFPAARWSAALKGLEGQRRVTLHDPEKKPSGEPPPSPVPARGSDRWTDWIFACLKDQQVTLDVVHMVTRGMWANGEACLLISSSPDEKRGLEPTSTVDIDQLALLFNRAGAWAATFTPPSSPYEKAVAILADAFARARPGAVFFNRGADAGDDAMLAAVGDLLFSARPSTAPLLQHSFVYCHPAFVRGEAPQSAGLAAGIVAGSAELLAQHAPLGQRVAAALLSRIPGAPDVKLEAPPTWIAAFQRYLEASQLDDARRTSSDVFLTQMRPGSVEAVKALGAASEKTIATFTALRGVLQNYKKLNEED